MDSDPLSGDIVFQLLLLVFLTAVNAFFSGAEMAVVSVNKNKIHRLAEQGDRRAGLIEQLLKDSTVFLSTIQVAITFAGFFSSASAATGISQVLAVRMEQIGVPYSKTLAQSRSASKTRNNCAFFTSMSITMHSPLMGWKFSFGRISGSMYFRAPRLRTIVLKTMCTASGWMPSTS